MGKMLIVANVSKEHIRKFHIPFILRMREEGWIVDVACRMDAPIPECDHAFDLPCDRNPFRGGLTKSISLLRGILKNNSYDVVICNTITGSMVTRIAANDYRKNGLKVIYINHGLHFFPGASPLRWLMGYPLEKLLAPMTDVMVTINSTDYDTAKAHLNPGSVEKIHGIGVNLERFRACRITEAEREHLRREIGIESGDTVLTYVAEINTNKNQALLLEALKRVLPSVPNVRLLLIGPEHDGGKLRSSVAAQGLSDRVFFLGWREDVPKLLNISDIYVVSSKSEGLGVNLIEAMACGLPVVATRNRGHEEIIRDGENGFLIDPDAPEQMARDVLRIIADPDLNATITEQAQRDIGKFETDCVIEELKHILDSYL